MISASFHRHRHWTRLIPEDFRFDFFLFRSIIFRKPKPETHDSTVLMGCSASRRLHQYVRLTTTRRRVAFTCSRVDLTCGCVTHTRRRVDWFLQRVLYSSDPQQCRRSFLRVSVVVRCPSPARVIHAPVIGFWAAPFLRLLQVSLRLLHCCCCCLKILMAYLLYLLVLFCSLCLLLWVLAFIWFLAVPTLQLLLHSDSCLTRIELLTEFLCVSNRLVRSWNRPGLPLILFELWVNTIASCSVLLDRIQYCSYFSTVIYHWGYVVGVPTPFLFFGSPTSSSFWIRSGKDPPL
jgi:hypothetical protein